MPFCWFSLDVWTEPLEYLDVKIYPTLFILQLVKKLPFLVYSCTSSLKRVPRFDRNLPPPPLAVIPFSTPLLNFSPGSLPLIKSQTLMSVKYLINRPFAAKPSRFIKLWAITEMGKVCGKWKKCLRPLTLKDEIL